MLSDSCTVEQHLQVYGHSLKDLLSCVKIHCTQFVSISIRNVPSLHMWPVLDAVSH